MPSINGVKPLFRLVFFRQQQSMKKTFTVNGTGKKTKKKQQKKSYGTVRLSEDTWCSLGTDGHLPMASSSSEHLVEGELPVQVLLDDVQPLRISWLSLQFLHRTEMEKKAKMSESNCPMSPQDVLPKVSF